MWSYSHNGQDNARLVFSVIDHVLMIRTGMREIIELIRKHQKYVTFCDSNHLIFITAPQIIHVACLYLKLSHTQLILT